MEKFLKRRGFHGLLVKSEGKDLKWYLTASSAKRDFENLNIVYRDVTVRVKGLPIAYVPYLRMPDPSVDRAQGFCSRGGA